MSTRELGDYCPSPARGKLTVPLVVGRKYVLHDLGYAPEVVEASHSFDDDDGQEWVRFTGTGYGAIKDTGVVAGVEDLVHLEDYVEPKPEPKVRAEVRKVPVIEAFEEEFEDLDDLQEQIYQNLDLKRAEDRQTLREILDAIDEFEKGV